MIVDVKNIVTINFNIDNYLTILSEWKNKFPLKETDNKKQEINPLLNVTGTSNDFLPIPLRLTNELITEPNL